MRMMAHIFLTCAMTVSAAGPALSDTIYSEDFQDGKTTGWEVKGKGDVRLSSYAENVSLQLSAGAVAVTTVSTAGFHNVRLDLAFAARGLAGDDACIGDISVDSGHHWIEIYRIRHGQDDGLTLYAGGGANAAMDDRMNLVIRLRAAVANPSATCWADNIVLSGDKTAPIPFRPAFAADGSRTALTYAELTGANAPAPVDIAAFAPSPDAGPATNVFSGRLSFGAERKGSGFHVLKDVYGDGVANSGAARHLPPFDFAFVQSGAALIPVRRGAIPGTHPEWEFILEPGRVWNEPGDRGLTRAAIPFALEERNANCLHHGMATFLFGNNGQVSDVAYEIAKETCFYFKFDMWGRMAAKYAPGPVADRVQIARDYVREVAARMPVRPIAELPKAFPGADAEEFGSPAEVPAGAMTLYGLVANGVNYVGGCRTRMGDYPACDVLDVPSYSLAKSIVVGMGTMRLALLYPGVTRETVAAYVPECAEAGTWNDVTFGNLLDMASGHFNSPDDQADEDAPDLSPFFLAEDHARRIAFACTHYPRKAAPGTRWVYHTADTYLLGTALAAFYRSKTGSDFYKNVLAQSIWNRLQLSPSVFVMRRTYDAIAQPLTGYGLTLHRDDIAKLATFVNVDHGVLDGRALLDPAMLRGALQQNPDDRGMTASGEDYRYHNGFWAWNAQHVLGCRIPTWIPFMSGYGGIVVALMPNGFSYYYFSDGGVWAWSRAAREADKLKPFCER